LNSTNEIPTSHSLEHLT